MVTAGGDGISPIDSCTRSLNVATSTGYRCSTGSLSKGPNAAGPARPSGSEGRRSDPSARPSRKKGRQPSRGEPRGDWCEVPLPAPASVSRVGSCLAAAMRVGHEGWQQSERAPPTLPPAARPWLPRVRPPPMPAGRDCSLAQCEWTEVRLREISKGWED